MEETKKVIARGLPIANTLENKVGVVCKVRFGELAVSEMNVLMALVRYSNNNSLFMTAVINKQIREENGMSDSGLSTAVFRLVKKGLIIRNGKTITLHPVFTNIMELDKLVISFV